MAEVTLGDAVWYPAIVTISISSKFAKKDSAVGSPHRGLTGGCVKIGVRLDGSTASAFWPEPPPKGAYRGIFNTHRVYYTPFYTEGGSAEHSV